MHFGQLCKLWALEGIYKQSCVLLVSVCRACDDHQAFVIPMCTILKQAFWF